MPVFARDARKTLETAAGGPSLAQLEGERESPFLRATPEEREHLANLLRMRVAITFGTVVWPSFLLMDLVLCVFMYEDVPIIYPVLVRLLVTPLHFAYLWRLSARPTLSPRGLVWVDTANFVLVSALTAVLGCLMGGIAGPYPPGVFLILICRNAFLIQPWRRSVGPNMLVVFAHFAVYAAAELWRPGTVLTIPAPGCYALVALHLCSLTCGAGLLTAATNTTWALRRRVFEARNLGRYRLSARIGEGGHGEVWRAYHPGMRQEVAIKVLRSEVSEDERALGRFEREIEALCKLRHPHTIRILDYGVTTDGVCYYAMELLEGMTLAHLVHAQGPLEPSRVIHFALQIASALSEAHQHGIVHRDIKPANVFVLSSEAAADYAKLLDFGVAKMQGDGQITRTGMVVGTPGFMAPEVLMGKEADQRADVYGVGALMFFMLTGTSPVDSWREHVSSDLPLDLVHVLTRCFARSPEGRYADAGALASALSGLKDAHVWRPVASHPTQEAPHIAAPTQTAPRRS